MQTSFLNDYWEKRLKLSREVWDEAMVCAAVKFIVGELGLRKIYFHTPESGRLYKKIRYSAPPRSVYTDLPRKFCFRQVDESPSFLGRRKSQRVPFQLLEL